MTEEQNYLSTDQEKQLAKKTNKQIGIALIVYSILAIALSIYSKGQIGLAVGSGIINCLFAINFLRNERKAKKPESISPAQHSASSRILRRTRA